MFVVSKAYYGVKQQQNARLLDNFLLSCYPFNKHWDVCPSMRMLRKLILDLFSGVGRP